MATRMQQRRGTASQWTSADPILAAGEIGYETDTGEFRVGDGINTWSTLSPFKNLADLGGNLDDYIPLAEKGQPLGTASLDADGKVPYSQIPSIDELSQDAVNAALVAGTGLDKTYNDSSNTITLDIDSTVATKTYADGAVSTHSSDTTDVHGISDTANLVYTNDSRLSDTRTPSDLSVTAGKIAADAVTTAKIINDAVTTAKIVDGAITSAKIADGAIVDADISSSAAIDKTKISGTAITAADTGTVTSIMIADGTIVNSDINASAAIAQSKISGLTTDLAAKAPLAAPSLTGNASAENLTITGTLTVNGTTTTVSSTNLEVTDPLIYIGTGNSANSKDLGLVGHFDDGTYQHTGIVRDATDGKWKLFSGVTTEPSDTIDFGTWTKDTLVIGALEATSATIGNVSNTELQYLDGVTSAIQTQINSKAPSANPTFTGTVTLPTGTVTSDMILDGTIVDADINSSAAIAATKISGTAVTQADTATVTNTMLAGSIANSKLANNSITLGSTTIALGETKGTEAVVISNLNINTPTIIGGLISQATLKNIVEQTTVQASAATGTIDYDTAYTNDLYYTSNASANFTLNFRSFSSQTLNSAMTTGTTMTRVFRNTNGSTAYYPNVIQIDGTTITPKWLGGAAPAAGNANSVDVYTFVITKTASATFAVFASVSKFA